MITTMVMITTLITGLTLFTVLLNSSTEEEVEAENKDQVVTEAPTFSTPELPALVLGDNFVTDTSTPLSYIETRQIVLDMQEEHLALLEDERQEELEALREARALAKAEEQAAQLAKEIEAERIAKEKAEAAQLEKDRIEYLAQEKAAKEKKAKEQAAAATPTTPTPTEVKEEKPQVTVASTKKAAPVKAKAKTETKPEVKAQPSQQASSYLLAQLVESEAKGEPFEGKVAVAEVVLNRVRSGNFPNSIEGVVFQKGQFQVVSNGSIHNAPSQTSINASNQALGGSQVAGGALFFYNPRIATDRWQDSLRTITTIGNHTFKNY